MKPAYTVVLVGAALATAMATAVAGAQHGGSLPLQARSIGASASPRSVGATGEVREVIHTAGYTYLLVDSGEEKSWAAAPYFEVEVGDRVAIPAGFPMFDYYSKTLKRSFDLVRFVPYVAVEGRNERSRPVGDLRDTGHPSPPQPPADDLRGIPKAAGGRTVGEIFDQKESLASREVSVRGRVVKFLSQIMGKNWVHLQDGTAGETGADDLTVTTDSVVAVGDTVLVRGIVGVDKDFGFGYQYDVIVEDASVTAE